MPNIFITGIDTDVGKTYAAGLVARFLKKQGKSVITQKLIQTGGTGFSEDVKLHRKIMGIDYNEDDVSGLTCPYIFRYPSSPHLSAKLENIQIDVNKITEATTGLTAKYEYVIIEGIGGISVPLTDDILLIDYIESMKYPVIIVSSSKLGSINHTLLTIDALIRRGLDIYGIIYNTHPEENIEIADDSRNVFVRYLNKFGVNAPVIDMPHVSLDSIPDVDFSSVINS